LHRRIVVYFHGAPGAPEECSTFDLEGKNHGLTFICFDRFSAAAPLESGDYLEAMAGKQVFKLAKAAPALFVLLSYWQGLLAWLAPNALFRLLFASAAGADITLFMPAPSCTRNMPAIRQGIT